MRFAFDVKALLSEGLAETEDRDVLLMAQRENRILITLDRDFEEYFHATSTAPTAGIIYLDFSRRYRDNSEVRRVLGEFFSSQASTIDLRNSLIVLKDGDVLIYRPKPDD
jgi:predicted nuclease of predicted toxin-antitoxin system